MASFSSEQIAAKFASIGNLPTLPTAAIEALAVANNPDCSIPELSGVILKDASLAASVLKMVNSSFYAAREPITSLERAVVRLGLRETRQLLVAVGMKSVFLKVPKKIGDTRDRLWKHSSDCATFAAHLADRLALRNKGEIYTAGLSHDFGKILMAVGFPDVFQEIYRGYGVSSAEDLEREEQALGFTHCQIGASIGQSWRLPETTCEAAQYHHTPGQATRDHALVAVVSLADLLAADDPAAIPPLADTPAWSLLCEHVPAAATLDPTTLPATCRDAAESAAPVA